MMIENVSTIERNKAGDLGKNFMSLYNSKTHCGLDIQLTSSLRIQAWETLFLLKEYEQICGLGSSREYKNWHQALFPLLLQQSDGNIKQQ